MFFAGGGTLKISPSLSSFPQGPLAAFLAFKGAHIAAQSLNKASGQVGKFKLEVIAVLTAAAKKREMQLQIQQKGSKKMWLIGDA